MITLTIYLIVALFILLWTYTSLPKFFKFKRYKEILASQAIPKWSVSTLAWLIPIAELAVVGLLLLPQTRLLGLYASFLLMLIFTIYVGGIMLSAYDRYPCPCGAMFRRMGWRKHFRVNIYLSSIALIGILLLTYGMK